MAGRVFKFPGTLSERDRAFLSDIGEGPILVGSQQFKWLHERGITWEDLEPEMNLPSNVYRETVDKLDAAMSEFFKDNVSHPAHHTQYKGLEVIDLTEQMNFNRGNAVKYICRAGFKNDEIEDLKKAAWYLNREIERITRNQEGTT